MYDAVETDSSDEAVPFAGRRVWIRDRVGGTSRPVAETNSIAPGISGNGCVVAYTVVSSDRAELTVVDRCVNPIEFPLPIGALVDTVALDAAAIGAVAGCGAVAVVRRVDDRLVERSGDPEVCPPGSRRAARPGPDLRRRCRGCSRRDDRRTDRCLRRWADGGLSGRTGIVPVRAEPRECLRVDAGHSATRSGIDLADTGGGGGVIEFGRHRRSPQTARSWSSSPRRSTSPSLERRR